MLPLPLLRKILQWEIQNPWPLVQTLFGCSLYCDVVRDLSNPLSLSDTNTYFEYVCPLSTIETHGHAAAKYVLNISHETKSSLPLHTPNAKMYASSFLVKPEYIYHTFKIQIVNIWDDQVVVVTELYFELYVQ